MLKYAFIILTILTIAGCGSKPQGLNLPSGEKVALVNGQAITGAEINKKAEGQIKKLEGEAYKIQRAALDLIVREQILEQAAKRNGMTMDEFFKKEITDKVQAPKEDKMKELYEMHKGKDTRPYKEVKPQIEMYLIRSEQAKLQQDLMAKLRKEAKVEIYLETPKVKVEGFESAPFMGPKDAPITMIEFSDYQCPFCKRARETVWKIMENYDGKIKYIFLDFPLSFHRESEKAHEAARCAGDQGKYYEYNKVLFNNQAKIDVPSLKKYAKNLGLDAKIFDKCLDSGEKAEIVNKYLESGAKAGVTGTPAYFINGVMVSGAQPYESFVEVIEMELNR